MVLNALLNTILHFVEDDLLLADLQLTCRVVYGSFLVVDVGLGLQSSMRT